MKVSAEMWKHQREMIDFVAGRFDLSPDGEFGTADSRYAWWIAGCGVGKTLASLKMAEEREFKRIFVVTKKAAISSAWQGDINRFATDIVALYLNDISYRWTARTGMVKLGRETSNQKAAEITLAAAFAELHRETLIVVVNYETAVLMAHTIETMQFDLVIFDESHKLKAHNSKTSKILAKATFDVPFKLIMTGTAWDDRPTDVYGQVRALSPIVQNRNNVYSYHLGLWGAFFEKYVTYTTMDNIKIPRSYKNIDKLQAILNDFTLHVDKETVLDLPPVIEIERRVELPPSLRKAYTDLENDLVAEIGEDLLTVNNRLTQALRLHQLTGGFYNKTGDETKRVVETRDNPKVQAVLDILDEIGGKPVVIFTRFKQDVILLEDAIEDAGYETRKLVGGIYQHDAWQAGAGQVLIANIQAGGTGVNLTRARYGIYYSVGHSRTDYEQSLARIRRAGSDASLPITYYRIIAENTVDEEIWRGLGGKGDMALFLLRGLVHKVTGQNLPDPESREQLGLDIL